MDNRNNLKEELKSGIMQMRQRVNELQLENEDKRGLVGKLQQMEKKYRILTDESCDIISLHSIDGSECLYINPAASNLLDYQEWEFLGTNSLKITDLVCAEDREVLLKIFNDTLEQGEGEGRLRYQKRNSGFNWFEVVGRLIEDENDNPVVLLRSRDINEQTRVENEMQVQNEELQRGYEEIEQLNTQLSEFHKTLENTNTRLQCSEEQLQLALWGANECVWEWNMLTGKFSINDKWANVMGYDWDSTTISTEQWENIFHHEDAGRVSIALQSYIEGKTSHFTVEARIKNGVGDYIWVLVNGKLVFEDKSGRTLRMIGLCQDISDCRESRQKLEDSEVRYRNLFEKNPIGLCKCDCEGNITDVNNAMVDIFGAPSQAEIKAINILSETAKIMLPGIEELIAVCKSGESCNGEIKVHTLWGKEIWLYYRMDPIMDQYNNFQEAMIVCEEISARKKAEDKIHYLSFNDSLTGLYNRAFYEEELKRLDTKRQLPLTIVMGDLNGLKLVNDAFGHRQGDAALQKMAEILRSSCRQEDIIARIGGDELVSLVDIPRAMLRFIFTASTF